MPADPFPADQFSTDPFPDDPPPTVRISGPGDIAAALPILIGFRPRESLVVVSLRAGKPQVFGLTARVDLPPPALRSRVVDGVVRSLATDGPAAVVVAVVSEDDDVRTAPVRPGFADGVPVPELPHRDVVREAVQAFARVGVPVREPLLVRRGRWWSYDCTRPCCAPDAGTPLPAGTSELAAATALTGQVVEGDRADLSRRIAPVGFLAAAGMAAACDEVGSAMALRSLVDGWDAVTAESGTLVEDAVATMGRPGAARLTDQQVARLAWGLRELEVRDGALSFALGPSASAAEVLWTELTRRAPAPLDAAPATLLAVSAWVRGDGAMANVALERALTSEPSYTLAGLLRTALDACIPPAEVRQLVATVTGAAVGPAGERAAGEWGGR